MAREEGLEYLPEGFREGGRVNNRSAESAEGAQRYLGRVDASASSFGGADAYVSALNANGERQSKGAGRAAEGREEMAGSDSRVADLGEETDADADVAMRTGGGDGRSGSGDNPVSRGVADGM